MEILQDSYFLPILGQKLWSNWCECVSQYQCILSKPSLAIACSSGVDKASKRSAEGLPHSEVKKFIREDYSETLCREVARDKSFLS